MRLPESVHLIWSASSCLAIVKQRHANWVTPEQDTEGNDNDCVARIMQEMFSNNERKPDLRDWKVIRGNQFKTILLKRNLQADGYLLIELTME